MPLKPVTLDDKYDLGQSRIFVTGYQALIRLTLMQKARDRRAGLNTAGYVTGYRGSPLGGLDYQFQRAEARLTQDEAERIGCDWDSVEETGGGQSRRHHDYAHRCT